MRRTILVLGALFFSLTFHGQLAIEQWQEHFPNTGTVGVTYGNNRIYCATERMVFSVNMIDNSIEQFSKTNRLSDVGISAISFDAATSTVVIGYENGNIDLVQDKKTTNISSILNSGIFGVKSINQIFIEDGRCYFSCGFGIVYFDLVNQEVIDTYIIGPGGANLQVNALTKYNGKIYAATDIGLMEADENNSFLVSFENWNQVNNIPNFDRRVIDVDALEDRLIFVQRDPDEDDIVYATQDFLLYSEVMAGNQLRGVDVANNRVVVRDQFGVVVYAPDLSYLYIVAYGDGIGARATGSLVLNENEIWLGDELKGLVRFIPSVQQFEIVRPQGPAHVDNYRIQFIEGRLFKSSGSPASNWSRTFNQNGVEVMTDGEWSTFDYVQSPFLIENSIRDFMSVAVDPNDESHWFAATWGSGLVEFQNGEAVNLFNAQNSPLSDAGETIGPPIASVLYDENDNLWMTNGYSETPILVVSPEGDWKALSAVNAGATGNDLYADMIISQLGYKWIVRPRGHGLVVYNDNNTPFDDADDEAVAITNQVGQGNLPTMDVFSIAEDLNGEIWVGTGEGVAVFYNSGGVFSGNNFDAQQILLEQDGNIQILLETENVTSIQVDGANRKWLGTSNSGVFLMSPDGTEEIYHFTSTNSPLPSNSIRSITLDGESGEVFFGTDQGVVSFKSTASDGEASNTCSKVYPNPVRENYDGPIAIEGLERNTNVKITDVAGNLVYETTSEGGRAIWDGRSMRGERVTTGVYTALCVSPEANSKCVAKIMVIR